MEREGDNPDVGTFGVDNNNNVAEEKDIIKQRDAQLESDNNPKAAQGENNELAKKKNKKGRKKLQVNIEDPNPKEDVQQVMVAQMMEKSFIGETSFLKQDFKKKLAELDPAVALNAEDFPKKKRKRNRKRNKKDVLSSSEDLEVDDINDETPVQVEVAPKETEQGYSASIPDSVEKQIIQVEMKHVSSHVVENYEILPTEESKVIEELATTVFSPASPAQASTPAPSFNDSPDKTKEEDFSAIPQENPTDEEHAFTQQLEEKLNQLASGLTIEVGLGSVDKSSSDKSLLLPITPHTSLQTILDLSKGKDGLIGLFGNIDLWKKNNPKLLISVKCVIDQLIEQAIAVIDKKELKNEVGVEDVYCFPTQANSVLRELSKNSGLEVGVESAEVQCEVETLCKDSAGLEVGVESVEVESEVGTMGKNSVLQLVVESAEVESAVGTLGKNSGREVDVESAEVESEVVEEKETENLQDENPTRVVTVNDLDGKEGAAELSVHPNPSDKEIETLHFHRQLSLQEKAFASESDYGLAKEQDECLDLMNSNPQCQHYPPVQGTWENRSAPVELKQVVTASHEDQVKGEMIRKQIIANTSNRFATIPFNKSADQSKTSIRSVSSSNTRRSTLKSEASANTRRRSLSRRLSDGVRNVIPCIRPRKSITSQDAYQPTDAKLASGTLPKIMKKPGKKFGNQM